MPGPKMGNTYPNSISAYPSWQAHVTPYTAEWGNSVGFEFHSVEYELGVNPKGSFASVKDRLDSLGVRAGYNYFSVAYTHSIQSLGAITTLQTVQLEQVLIDVGNQLDIVNSKITIQKAGWYYIHATVLVEDLAIGGDSIVRIFLWAPPATAYSQVYSQIADKGLHTIHTTVVRYFEVGSEIYLKIAQLSANTFNVRPDWGQTRLFVRNLR